MSNPSKPISPRWKEKIVFLNRSSRATKGGPRWSFSVLAVVGDSSGRVGVGWGKAKEVAEAIYKAGASALAQMVKVPFDAATPPHEAWGQFCGARVFLRPAALGTGIIASHVVRAVLECAGIRDVVAKSLGARNPVNVAKAAVAALMNIRTREENDEKRGLRRKRPRTLFLKPLEPDKLAEP